MSRLMHVPMSLLGEDLCIRHVYGYGIKVRIDLKSWAVNGECDFIGLSDSLVDMSSVVVVILDRSFLL